MADGFQVVLGPQAKTLSVWPGDCCHGLPGWNLALGIVAETDGATGHLEQVENAAEKVSFSKSLTSLALSVKQNFQGRG